MEKNNLKSANAQEVVNKICEAFGISADQVNVDTRTIKNENGEVQEIVECSVNVPDEDGSALEYKNTTITTEREPSVEDYSQNNNAWEEIHKSIKNLFNSDRAKTLKDAWAELVNAIANSGDEDEVTEECECDECLCDCDDCDCGETHCCQCGTPCVVEECHDCSKPSEPAEAAPRRTPNASEIKHLLKNKFDAVIMQQRKEREERLAAERAKQRAEKAKKFYQLLRDALIKGVIAAIRDEKYQSLTNDLDADDAGIGITFSENETTELEIALRDQTGFCGEMDFEFLHSDVLASVVFEICRHLGFRDGVGYVAEDGITYFKLWF